MTRIGKLKEKKDFDRVYKKGRSIQGAHMYLKTIPNLLEQSRLKVVVSKKISNKAVIRNKNRRRVEEALKIVSPQIKTGYDGVIFLLKNTNEMVHRDISNELLGLLKRAGIIA